MARFGQIFRGNQVENAENAGCTGLILFSDPEEVAAEGTRPIDVYPNTFWLPEDGMQRGTLFNGDGDPETTLWPSLPDVYRIFGDDLNQVLPKIPVQPIGYGDAKLIFDLLVGPDSPDHWHGGIEDASYTIGGRFNRRTCNGCEAKIQVNNENRRVNSTSVLGMLTGEVEPDRYVIMGNHRDAWVYGAVDPSSGTAQLMEVVRVLGAKRQNDNWRPRRSMLFLSWTAEEFGLIGSREFTEDFLTKLSDRTVAYLNTDICSGGTIMTASASPVIKHLLWEATKAVPGPEGIGLDSYYDYWEDWTHEGGNFGNPEIGLPGAGSDHASFMFLPGIPVIDMAFKPDFHIYANLEHTSYPTYHTAYETIDLVNNFHDPDYYYHGTCAKLNLFLGRQLADEIVLDFRPEEYGTLMEESYAIMERQEIILQLNGLGVETEYWKNQIDQYVLLSEIWRNRFESFTNGTTDPYQARTINDQMMKIDRTFILPQGLPMRPSYCHAIISPSLHNSYGGGSFPGISDLLYGIDDLQGGELQSRIDMLNRHVADLATVIKRAGDYLKEVDTIL